MLILNDTHPLTADQLAQIETLSGEKLSGVRDIAPQFDQQQPFAPQIEALISSTPIWGGVWGW